MEFNVAVIGATGAVGREIINILYERKFPIKNIFPIASDKSVGKEIYFGDSKLKLGKLENLDFSDLDFALFSAGSEISKQYASSAAKKNCIVIDNSSAWRMNPEVPLIVPEVNASALELLSDKKIIANPNCSTAQLVVALKPLHDEANIKRVVVSTYQSTSGAGQKAMDELFNQTKSIFVNDPIKIENFTKQIAFNVIPHIDVFLDDKSTKEEWKMVVETKKILDPKIKLTATCVRVPTFVGHAESVNIEFNKSISAEKAIEILRESPGIMVIDKDEDGGYSTPIDCVGDYATFVSRIREDSSIENGLNIWIVSDNLRKGAALNAVQIAESVINRGLIKKV
ncbi:MAG: aspartate-semialdehyde dehydrogenase [Rhodospirillaceae bacterium]|nr:aspartate-semialdehyde dehydrogenase [Rhodospirillaceae bacterium]|tara:strand:+ start:609 stop:1631 length:1023 start_codon:yes stop_codon:yes gene_type:complete